MSQSNRSLKVMPFLAFLTPILKAREVRRLYKPASSFAVLGGATTHISLYCIYKLKQIRSAITLMKGVRSFIFSGFSAFSAFKSIYKKLSTPITMFFLGANSLPLQENNQSRTNYKNIANCTSLVGTTWDTISNNITKCWNISRNTTRNIIFIKLIPLFVLSGQSNSLYGGES